MNRYQLMVLNDNGTQLTLNTMIEWRRVLGFEWHYTAPGKPMQNGFV